MNGLVYIQYEQYVWIQTNKSWMMWYVLNTNRLYLVPILTSLVLYWQIQTNTYRYEPIKMNGFHVLNTNGTYWLDHVTHVCWPGGFININVDYCFHCRADRDTKSNLQLTGTTVCSTADTCLPVSLQNNVLSELSRGKTDSLARSFRATTHNAPVEINHDKLDCARADR